MKRNRPDVSNRQRAPSGAAVMRPEVTDALTRALFEEWAERGYAAVALERVARRAGVGKAALYRRWPSKLAMVSDALHRVGVTITEVPDTGTLEGDLRAMLLSFRRVLRHPLVRRIVPDIHAEMARNDELAAAVRPFQRARRERARVILERAMARGEVSSTLDEEMAFDLVGSPLYWRLTVIGGRASRAYVDALARALAAGLRA